MKPKKPVQRGPPVAINQRQENAGLQFRVSHKEMLTKVDGGEFSQAQYKIQPGLSLTFPWLSGIAPGFENYEIMNLRFEYIPRCSTATAGAIYMGVDYDSGDLVNLTDEQTVSQYAGTITQRIYQNTTYQFKIQRMRKGGRLYTRNGSLQANRAIQDYDAGTFFYVVAGSPAGIMGSVYISYDIKFTVPQPFVNDVISQRSLKVYQENEYPNTIANIEGFQLNPAYDTYNNIIEADGPIQVNDTLKLFENFTGENFSGIFNLEGIFSPDTSELIIDSIIASLSDITGTTGTVKSIVDGSVLTSLPVTKSINDALQWVLTATAMVALPTVSSRFKIGTPNHSLISGSKVLNFVQYFSPFLI